MKGIRPGVLSEIMSLAENDPNSYDDDKMKDLVQTAKDIQALLLEFSNFNIINYPQMLFVSFLLRNFSSDKYD